MKNCDVNGCDRSDRVPGLHRREGASCDTSDPASTPTNVPATSRERRRAERSGRPFVETRMVWPCGK